MRTVLFAFKCHAEFLFWRCFLNGLRFSLSRRPGGARDAFTKRAVEETDPPVEDLFHLEMKFETYLSLFLSPRDENQQNMTKYNRSRALLSRDQEQTVPEI
jgi:hypothetical protein